MAHHQPYLSAQANANDAGRAVLVGGVALICVTFVPVISETAFATIERWQNCGRLQSTGARSSNRWRAPPILQSPIPGGKVSQETLAICSPVAIFPIPISDVLGTTQHRQVNVFEAGLMERRFNAVLKTPLAGKRHFANIDDGFNVVVRKQGHEPGEVDAFIADGEDHDDVARFECYEFSRFARLVTKVRGTPQSEKPPIFRALYQRAASKPTQDTTYAETGRPRGQFLRAMQTSPPTTAPATPHPSKPQPLGRGCEQPRCARGNPKAAAAGGNEDDEGAESGAKAPDRNRGREQRAPPEGGPRSAATKLPTKHNTQFNGSDTPSVRPAKPTSQPPAQPLHQAQDSPSPPNARIKPTADRACSPLSCTDTRCCSNTLRSASITSR